MYFPVSVFLIPPITLGVKQSTDTHSTDTILLLGTSRLSNYYTNAPSDSNIRFLCKCNSSGEQILAQYATVGISNYSLSALNFRVLFLSVVITNILFLRTRTYFAAANITLRNIGGRLRKDTSMGTLWK